METTTPFLMFLGAISLLGVYLNIAEILSVDSSTLGENSSYSSIENRSLEIPESLKYQNITLLGNITQLNQTEILGSPIHLKGLEYKSVQANNSTFRSRASSDLGSHLAEYSQEAEPGIRLLSGYLVPASSANSSLENSNSVVEFFNP